ncbi:lysylphosphatidylglycerol synthase domain-containing protein [Pseudonocardia sp. H11422]|uniref:lysylphosphatidylglycerol synthase domain-containing protein n=1 Tax=Pseudonocardia sp. H11422 TaxID=2835866 RepID=UPI001BDCD401|nr:lysylphosphatidylglycerol synthase domain-containing protein [Pseudonocardia sp. H11422]
MKRLRHLVGLGIAVVGVVYLVRVVDGAALGDVLAALLAEPGGLALALGCYAAAFGLRTAAWCRVLPGLGTGQSWAGLHVSLLGNHVLPLRLGEVLRVTGVLRRTSLPAAPVIASAVTLRAADLVAVLGLAALAAPAVLVGLVPGWVPATATGGLVLVGALGVGWLVRLGRAGTGTAPRLPGPAVLIAVVLAWVLEAAVVFEIARVAGHPLGVGEAVAITAATIAAQAVAVTPGGFGSYEAAATAALVALGVPAGPAFAIALTTHGVKTVYALVVGGVALGVPAPSYLGRFRLPRRLPPRPTAAMVPNDAPVVAFLPAHDEEDAVADVVARIPQRVGGRRVLTIVVDDGSTDATAERAAAAGAHVVSLRPNQGLGAAVRRGLAEAVAERPAVVVYLDADGEYFPEDLAALAAPVLAGTADYVIGSRFTGRIERMPARRRLGNQVLTAGLRWVVRRRDLTDGQSGYRAFSPDAAAAAEIVHDYNYAQVLTLDLLGKGFRYAEVPICYRFRTTGTSFITLGRYLRKVLPAVHRELNFGDVPAPAEAAASSAAS